MDYQAERLGLIVDAAEQSMDIVQRFSNDPIGAGNIQTASGPIKNLKQVSADIKSDGEAAIDVAVTELIDTLKTETSVGALIDGLTDTAALAEQSAARAKLAADYANATGKVYDTTAAGLAATTNTQFFSVVSADQKELLILYKNNAGTAQDTGKRYPSAVVVDSVRDAQNQHLSDLDSAGFRSYTGDGDVWPVMADAGNRVLLGYDRVKGEVVGKGLLKKSELNDAIYLLGGENGESQYTGLGPVWPLLTDADGRVLLGYDSAKHELIATGVLKKSELNDAVYLLGGENGEAQYTGPGPVWPVLTDAGGRVLLGYDQGAKKLVGAFPSVAQPGQAEQPKPLPAGTEPVAKDINHFLFYGQSLSVGAQGTPVLSTTQPYSNITFNGGPRAAAGDYSAFKPLVEDAISPAPDGGGNRGETPCSGAANYAVELAAMEGGVQPSSHVILASTAGHGGYSIDQLKKGTAWYQKVIDHVTAAKALATIAEKSYAVHAFAWIQGETDTDQNTKTQAAYRDLLRQLQRDIEADIKAIDGKDRPAPCVTYQVTYGIKKTPNIALAQLELAQTDSRFFLVTPCYHLPFAPDKTHLTAAGYKWIGCYFGRAYKRLVKDGVEPQFINPVSAVCRGTVLSIRFKVPVAPLVLDAATLAATTDHGFKVQDDTGALTLSNIRVVNGNTVQATLNRALGTNPAVRYGLDYLGSGLAISNGASGNLRDSESASVSIGGVSRPLYNVCPHFQLPIISLA